MATLPPANPARAATSSLALGSEAPELRATTSLKAQTIDELNKRTRLSGFSLEGSLKYQLEENLDARIAASLYAETGSSEALFQNEYAPARGLSLIEASAGWAPISGASLRVGAINQAFHDAPLLFSKITFPAATQQWSWEPAGSSLRLALLAEQAIPSASSGAATSTQGTPFYDFERLSAGVHHDSWMTEASVGHFAFHGLASATAQDALFRGNTVSPNPSRFIYGYEGLLAGARLELRGAPGLTLATGGNLVVNFRAPSTRNQGFLFFAETSLSAGPKLKLTPRFELFRNESDSTPGAYNSAALAHNNRRGFAFGIEASLPKSSLAVEARLVRAEVIEASPFQARFTGFSLNLRKSYDSL
ncbi:MAG: hypothetical protein NDJ90_05425 [Oligoflexia bacterium]|nr:hypothetical protein [Oligoflexia bacterium]